MRFFLFLSVPFVPSSVLVSTADSLLLIPSFLTADCHFTHPPSRSKPSNKYVKPSSASSSFGGKKQEAHIGSWPSESKEHVSERLKRFAGGEGGKEGGEGGEGGVERIVPGGSGGGAEKKEEKEDKVEIHFDDEDDKKHEKKEEGEKEKEKEAATAAA